MPGPQTLRLQTLRSQTLRSLLQPILQSLLRYANLLRYPPIPSESVGSTTPPPTMVFRIPPIHLARLQRGGPLGFLAPRPSLLLRVPLPAKAIPRRLLHNFQIP